jgi:hypothetical protein
MSQLSGRTENPLLPIVIKNYIFLAVLPLMLAKLERGELNLGQKQPPGRQICL